MNNANSNENLTTDTLVANKDLIERFSMPERGSIYGKIDRLTLISDYEVFEKYLNFPVDNSNYSDEYKKMLSYKRIMKLIDELGINLNDYYLFIAARTETSGSIKVSVSEPILKDKETIKLTIDSESPFGSVFTDDMAYYGFAYKIKKSIKYLDINSLKITLEEGLPESTLSEEEKMFNIMMGGFGYW